MHIKVLGIDLPKNIFQLCAINHAGKEVFNRQVRRARLASTVSNLEPDLIAMGACSGDRNPGNPGHPRFVGNLLHPTATFAGFLGAVY